MSLHFPSQLQQKLGHQEFKHEVALSSLLDCARSLFPDEHFERSPGPSCSSRLMSGTSSYDFEEDLTVNTILKLTEATMLKNIVALLPHLSVRADGGWSLWRGCRGEDDRQSQVEAIFREISTMCELCPCRDLGERFGLIVFTTVASLTGQTEVYSGRGPRVHSTTCSTGTSC